MRLQRLAFFGGEAKHEIFGEAVAVAFDLLVQPFYGHAVKLRQIAVEDDFLLAEHKNSGFYRDDKGRLGIVHVGILSGSARFEVAICDLIGDAEGHTRKSLKRRGRGEEPRRTQRKARSPRTAANGGKRSRAGRRIAAEGAEKSFSPQRSQRKAAKGAKKSFSAPFDFAQGRLRTQRTAAKIAKNSRKDPKELPRWTRSS